MRDFCEFESGCVAEVDHRSLQLGEPVEHRFEAGLADDLAGRFAGSDCKPFLELDFVELRGREVLLDLPTDHLVDDHAKRNLVATAPLELGEKTDRRRHPQRRSPDLRARRVPGSGRG